VSTTLLLTGFPGCGKTTIICRVMERLAHRHLGGFYTQELRNREGFRIGFKAIGINGRSANLASVSSPSKLRVGKYGVELLEFEDLIRDVLEFNEEVDLFIVDEIGKMECYSKLFVKLVRRLLASDAFVLATIASQGRGFIAELKQCDDIELIEVTLDNRDDLVEQVAARFT